MYKEAIQKLYQAYTGHAPDAIEPLAGAGSNRKYFRLKGHPQLIGVYGTSADENRAFLYMSKHFTAKGLPVPRVHIASSDGMAYLQEDLGNVSLFQAIAQGRQTGMFNEEETTLLRRTIRLLPRFQFEGAEGMDFSICYPQAEFNRRSILWDLNYFKYCFLKATGIDFQEELLENDFEHMATFLLAESYDTFMYRDFQSRNVMVCNGEPFFIDFQGGRKGPIYYDVASFLWQAKARFPQELRNDLVHEYLEAAHPYSCIDEKSFHDRLSHFVLFRTLQVLGTYGFRGYFERKPHFLQSIPYAIGNLRQLLAHRFKEYPYLSDLLHQLTELSPSATPYSDQTAMPDRQQLTVEVISFSYKKGIPCDTSGNGGGYVFDCRAIHNPGRHEAYKQLTGRDEPVIRFLEENGEMCIFIEHAEALVDAHVKRFLERGFTHLSVCFGCTGGQHRSVYAAEHVARHIHERFGVKVCLIHREQDIKQTFDYRP